MRIRFKSLSLSIGLSLVLFACFQIIAPASTINGPVPKGLTCSCTAPDGLCSASRYCPEGGCSAVCLNGGRCVAWCKGEPIPILPGTSSARLISVDFKGLDATGISSVLSVAMEQKVTFTPYNNHNTLASAEIKDMPLLDLLGFLSQVGDITVAGTDVSFNQLYNVRNQISTNPNVRFSLNLSGYSIEEVMPLISFFSGKKVVFANSERANLKKEMNISVNNVTMAEFMSSFKLQFADR